MVTAKREGTGQAIIGSMILWHCKGGRMAVDECEWIRLVYRTEKDSSMKRRLYSAVGQSVNDEYELTLLAQQPKLRLGLRYWETSPTQSILSNFMAGINFKFPLPSIFVLPYLKRPTKINDWLIMEILFSFQQNSLSLFCSRLNRSKQNKFSVCRPAFPLLRAGTQPISQIYRFVTSHI